MQVTVDLLKHAKTALERSATGLAELSLRLKKSAAGTGRAHRLMVEETVAELARLHAVLTCSYSEMVMAPKEELPALWRRFYVCYDQYLEAARLARTGLAQEGRQHAQGATALTAQPPAESVGSKEG
jgi:hypothetical protein